MCLRGVESEEMEVEGAGGRLLVCSDKKSIHQIVSERMMAQ